jgi:methyl-accepting chemotaxis protein
MRNLSLTPELERPVDNIHKEIHPMRKTLAIALMLTASLGLAACDKKSEDKAQDANQHAEQAQEKMNEAQDKVNDAAKENAEAAKDQAESNKAAAQEGTAPVAPAAPAAPVEAPKN